MIDKKKAVITAAAVIGLLAVVGLSKPGRVALTKMASLVAGQDVEQKARARHGWTSAIQDSVVRGTITYYDPDGMPTRRAAITVYRKHPDRLRVELDRNGVVEVSGFDRQDAWKAGFANLSEEQARDIRGMLRMWPERLFVTRGQGSGYREAGRRVEHERAAVPGQAAKALSQPFISDQVEMEDVIGLPPSGNRVGDRRRVYYYVDRNDSTVSTVRWLEPNDPRLDADDANTDRTDVRVDFSDWRTVNGVLLPFDLMHWNGGRVDFRIQVSEVLLNQNMPDTVFQNPNK